MTPCECQIERKIRSVLPPRYHKATLADLSETVYHLVETWLLAPTDGLFITGPSGTGKTHLAAGIVRFRLERRLDTQLKRLAEFYLALRTSFNSQLENETQIMDKLIACRFLVLDDLGSGSLSDHERRSTLELLDRRLNALRPTVVTSNWSLEEISRQMDDRIASRLAGFTAIELGGKDRRLSR